MADISELPTDLSNNDYKKAGEDIADILVETVGPVPADGTMPETLQMTQW